MLFRSTFRCSWFSRFEFDADFFINLIETLFVFKNYLGNLTIKDCEKFRKKRDTEKELEEIQSKAVQVKGKHVQFKFDSCLNSIVAYF